MIEFVTTRTDLNPDDKASIKLHLDLIKFHELLDWKKTAEVDDLIGALHPLVITINDKFGTKLSTNSIFDSLKVVSEARETLGLKDFWVNTEVTEFLQIYEALSISEASVERLFSYLGRCTENKRRNSILPKTLESLGHMYVKKR